MGFNYQMTGNVIKLDLAFSNKNKKFLNTEFA